MSHLKANSHSHVHVFGDMSVRFKGKSAIDELAKLPIDPISLEEDVIIERIGFVGIPGKLLSERKLSEYKEMAEMQ